MFRSLNPFKSSNKSSLSRDEKIKIILKQAHDFELALRAMDYVLDDRAEEGLALLNESEAKDGPDQTINVLAGGVIEFLEATLSFEPAEMKKASNTLSRSSNFLLRADSVLRVKTYGAVGFIHLVLSTLLRILSHYCFMRC